MCNIFVHNIHILEEKKPPHRAKTWSSWQFPLVKCTQKKLGTFGTGRFHNIPVYSQFDSVFESNMKHNKFNSWKTLSKTHLGTLSLSIFAWFHCQVWMFTRCNEVNTMPWCHVMPGLPLTLWGRAQRRWAPASWRGRSESGHGALRAMRPLRAQNSWQLGRPRRLKRLKRRVLALEIYCNNGIMQCM